MLIIYKLQLLPDRIGSLDKPPASLALLPSRASSRMRSNPALLAPQCRYEAIRVWSYTTFIVNEAVVNRIGADNISASTKYWRRQNISIDKILAPTKSTQTKSWRRCRRIFLLFDSAESTAADFSQARGIVERLLL
jgi:hypothetical protein